MSQHPAPINIPQVVERILQKTEAVIDEIHSLETLLPQGSVLIRHVKYLVVALYRAVLTEIEFSGNRTVPLMNAIRLKFLTLYWMAQHHISPAIFEHLFAVANFLRGVFSKMAQGVRGGKMCGPEDGAIRPE